MSVDAIPVLPPCGDRLKRGAAGPGNEDRETLRGHCLIGANSTSPNAAKRKPTRVLSRCPGAINIGICRTALRFPDLARLPEAVSEACYFSMLFPPRSSTSRDYLCLSSCTLACGSVQCGSANFGSARLSLSSALAHCCPSKNLGGRGGLGRLTLFSSSPKVPIMLVSRARRACRFPPGLFRPSQGARPRSSLLDYRGAYSVIIPANAPAAP